METWSPHSTLICWRQALNQGSFRVAEECTLEELGARIATIIANKVAIKNFWRLVKRISQVWEAVLANRSSARSCQCELSIISSRRASERCQSPKKTHMRLSLVFKTVWIGLFWCLSRYHKLSQMFQIWTVIIAILGANRAVEDPHSLKNTQKISVKHATRRRKSIRRKDMSCIACKTAPHIIDQEVLTEWTCRRSITLDLSISMIICLMVTIIIREAI